MIKQSKTKKKAATKYCAIHKVYFFEYCPFCPNTEQMAIEEEIYYKQKKIKDANDFGELIK